MFENEPGRVEEEMTLSNISVTPRTVIKEAGVVKKIINITAKTFKANRLIHDILDSLLRFLQEMSSDEGMLEARILRFSSVESKESS